MIFSFFFFFFFNDTATTEIYTLSLHDALPICGGRRWPASKCRAESGAKGSRGTGTYPGTPGGTGPSATDARSEEHTSELQSQSNLVCRLLLEKKKRITKQLLSSNRT